uniref:Uncharacterized protein n=1 Tax=Syphacia muris TaxID=451379 RepID=A0A0N5AZC3_9BILA
MKVWRINLVNYAAVSVVRRSEAVVRKELIYCSRYSLSEYLRHYSIVVGTLEIKDRCSSFVHHIGNPRLAYMAQQNFPLSDTDDLPKFHYANNAETMSRYELNGLNIVCVQCFEDENVRCSLTAAASSSLSPLAAALHMYW